MADIKITSKEHRAIQAVQLSGNGLALFVVSLFRRIENKIRLEVRIEELKFVSGKCGLRANEKAVGRRCHFTAEFKPDWR